MSKLLPNLPIEDLTTENDYIGIIKKGTLLKSFFLKNKHEFSQIKIFAIYGEWGSGKSTLMKYLEKELKGSFNTFFFESWEFESDNNLAHSLLEFLTNESNTTSNTLLKNGSKLVEGFAKSVTFKTPFANFNMDKMIEEVDKTSFLERKEQFKKDFREWENKITTKYKSPDYNIVFIDDLDRCEPENILNLLSAIKLFFTYGKKTIFLCGIDKKAIKEAVMNKYGDVVKSNEYLEKIFDISFSMPDGIANYKLIYHYFGDEKFYDDLTTVLICKFFDELNFKNPRRIKKILNKYLIIKRLVEANKSNEFILPNIMTKDSGNMFETYLTLYFLILAEFEPKIYKDLFDFNKKRINYTDALKRSNLNSTEINNISQNIFNYYNEKILYNSAFRTNDKVFFRMFLFNLLPLKVDTINSNFLIDSSSFSRYFHVELKTIEYFFTLFIFENESEINIEIKKMNLTLLDYKRMISNLI
tara:strand:+ start:128 stop:1543 length:1416 start_codon:yes stop_codon:yes gene_type:complete